MNSMALLAAESGATPCASVAKRQKNFPALCCRLNLALKILRIPNKTFWPLDWQMASTPRSSTTQPLADHLIASSAKSFMFNAASRLICMTYFLQKSIEGFGA